MSVDLPAPFSPRRAWISPGWTTRSMWSFATRDPKRFVIPRSSSFICAPYICCRPRRHPCGGGGEERGRVESSTRPRSAVPAALRRAGRGHLEVARDDLLLEGGELIEQALRQLRLERAEARQAHAL